MSRDQLTSPSHDNSGEQPAASTSVARAAFWAPPIYFDDLGVCEPSPSIDEIADATGDAIDEAAMFEFLVLGYPLDPSRTLVRSVRRVPPGATLVADRQLAVQPVRGAALPAASTTGGRLVDDFWARFVEAVDRTLSAHGDRRIAISLSGGIDSAAVACALAEIVRPERVQAITFGYLAVDDPEPRAARQIADHLGFDWTAIDVSDDDPLEPPADAPRYWPTPAETASNRAWRRLTDGALVFFGYGGDDLFRGNPRHWRDRIDAGELGAALREVLLTTVVHGRRPGLGTSRLLRRSRQRKLTVPTFIAEQARQSAGRTLGHLPDPSRTPNLDLLADPSWSGILDPMTAHHAVGAPFFDEDLARFVASIPSAPWLYGKEILRAALRGRLPEGIRSRPKSPVRFEGRLTFSPRNIDAAIEELRRANLADVVAVAAWNAAVRRGHCTLSEHADLARPLAVARLINRTGLRR